MSSPSLPPPYWVHTDVRGIDVALAAASLRASPGTVLGWGTATIEECTADFRALAVAAAYTLQSATRFPPTPLKPSDLPEPLPGDGVKITPIDSSTGPFVGIDPTVSNAAETIATGWWVLVDRFQRTRGTPAPFGTIAGGFNKQFLTRSGAPPESYVSVVGPGTATGFPILGAIAVVAGAALFGYLGFLGSEIVDRELARSEDSARLTGMINAAQRTLAMHTEADRVVGTSTPLNAGEQAVITALQGGIKALATPGVLPKPDDKGLFAGLGTVGILVGLGLVYLFVRKG